MTYLSSGEVRERTARSETPRRTLGVVAVLATLILLDLPTFAEDDACRDVDFVTAFDEWAFGFAHTSEDRRGRIVKWVEPVEIVTKGEGAGVYDPYVGRVAEELTALTGHPVRLAEERGNVIMYISDNPLLSARLDPWFQRNEEELLDVELAQLARRFFVFGKPFCAGSFSVSIGLWSETIEYSLIFIDTSYGEELLLSCLREEMAHAMGGPGDLTAKDCTLFDDRELPAEYSNLDKRMLATL